MCPAVCPKWGGEGGVKGPRGMVAKMVYEPVAGCRFLARYPLSGSEDDWARLWRDGHVFEDFATAERVAAMLRVEGEPHAYAVVHGNEEGEPVAATISVDQATAALRDEAYKARMERMHLD